MVNIGDRVRYDEVNGELDDIEGVIVEPTNDEVLDSMAQGDVMVQWGDGERFWEDPGTLVVIEP